MEYKVTTAEEFCKIFEGYIIKFEQNIYMDNETKTVYLIAPPKVLHHLGGRIKMLGE